MSHSKRKLKHTQVLHSQNRSKKKKKAKSKNRNFKKGKPRAGVSTEVKDKASQVTTKRNVMS